MIYLPNSFERYIASLRLYVQMSVLKRGNNLSQLKSLKRICLAEALYSSEKCPVDIIKLSDSILGSSVIILFQRGIYIKTELSGTGTYIINKKLYVALLMELISGCTSQNNVINIKTAVTKLVITVTGCNINKNIKNFLKVLCGAFLYERAGKKLIICIPVEKTEKPAEKIENEWCYILDRFSVVNVWLLNANGSHQ